MQHNRLAPPNRLNAFSTSAAAVASSPTATAGPQFVFVLSMLPQQVLWFAEVYRLAYERAQAELAPPRHHDRFFSVWN